MVSMYSGVYKELSGEQYLYHYYNEDQSINNNDFYLIDDFIKKKTDQRLDTRRTRNYSTRFNSKIITLSIGDICNINKGYCNIMSIGDDYFVVYVLSNSTLLKWYKCDSIDGVYTLLNYLISELKIFKI